MRPLPKKGPNSPYSPASRTILARTCLDCGKFADGESFPLINRGRGGRRKTCHDCTNRWKKRAREERGIGVPVPRPPESQQTKKRTQWTRADDDFLREHIGRMTYEELAVRLGRSTRAVYKRRDVLGLPKVRRSHRVAEPWRIVKEEEQHEGP
jgi:hypothetical protein